MTIGGNDIRFALNGLNLFNTGESYHPNRNGHSLGYLPLVRSVTG